MTGIPRRRTTEIENSEEASPSDLLRKLTIRLTTEQRRRLKNVANEIDSTIQDIAIAGFNCFLVARGLDPLDPNSPIQPPKKKRKPKQGGA
jgi:hypothetical protein